jgi:predicted Ser/Thr protein kinase
MTDDLERLELLLGELLDLPVQEQHARLSALQAADDPCAPMVARLLARHERGTDELPTPPDDGLLSPDLAPGPDPLTDPLLQRMLGDFTLVRLVGRGGMGRVYEARQASPARTVAVKVLATSGLASESIVQRFRREADLLGALEHPGICRVYAAGTATVGGEQVPFIAMEFVAGMPLDRAAAGLDRRSVLELVANVADAVDYAHGQGVVHRDLKPGNILVAATATGMQPKVLDFGVSRALGLDDQTGAMRTETGALLGTLAYMSPEQLAGQPADARSDIHALGVILYELLVGRRPFAGHDQKTTELRRALEHEAPRLRAVLPVADPDLEAVLACALEREPRRRYPSAAALAADLRAVCAGAPVSARRLTPVYRLLRCVRAQRRSLAIAAAVAVLLAGATLAALHFADAADSARREVAAGRGSRQLEGYLRSLHEADAALRAEDPAGASVRLLEVDLAMRGFEWRHWVAATERVRKGLAARGRDPDRPVVLQAESVRIEGISFRTACHEAWRFSEEGGTVEVLDVGTDRVRAVVHGLPHAPWRVAITPDARHVVVAGMGNASSLQVRDAVSDALLASRDGFREDDDHLVIDGRGAFAALGGKSGIVRLFRLPLLEPVGEASLRGRIDGLAFAPAGDRIAVASEPDGLSVLRVGDGARVVACDTRGGMPHYPTWSDDGSRLCSLNERETNLNLWDAATGRLLRRQPIPEGPMSLVRIPGAQRVAVGSTDGSVRVFDSAVTEQGVWAPLLTLRETDKTVHSLLVSRDGTALLACLDGGEWLRWHVPAADRIGPEWHAFAPAAAAPAEPR